MDGASQRRETGWDIAHAGRNFSGLLAGQVLSAVFSFATVWLLARGLGTTGYGSVVAIIAATQSIVILTVNWSSVSLFKNLEE